MKRSLWFTVLACLICTTQGLFAREIHVSKAGSDSAAGSRIEPYLTINKAASTARPGDTVRFENAVRQVSPVRRVPHGP